MIFTIIKNLTEKTGIKKKVSPHTFRHSFASHMVNRGASLRVVQEMLGHESITTTEIYTHLNDTKLRETVAQYNQLSEDGSQDPLGKPAEYLARLDFGPWYALDCRIDGMVRNPSITLGGLVVDESSGEVLAEGGGKVKGLYAAGRSAVGIASRSYVSGLSIADCIFAGRRAGNHAAQNRNHS